MPIIYIPDVEDFFACMDSNAFQYVVMRNFKNLNKSFPRYGSKQDIDLLIENRAVKPVLQKYHNIKRHEGVKCDIHSVLTQKETNLRGHVYYPYLLAQRMLDYRIRWQERFYVPSPEDWFYSFLYHIVYHRTETSGFDFFNAEVAKSSRYFNELKEASESSGIPIKYTLKDAHCCLVEKGYGIDNEVLILYVKREFERGRKSFFFGWLCNMWPGEMNLFVIRRIAVIHNKHIEILRMLKKRYRVLALKKVPWTVRLRKAKHMRGGKWRRGGKPYIAVVVFDPSPVAATSEERNINHHVFNRNQFFKPEVREWFTNTTSTGRKDIPLHSTDNEAKAIDHLPLFLVRRNKYSLCQTHT